MNDKKGQWPAEWIAEYEEEKRQVGTDESPVMTELAHRARYLFDLLNSSGPEVESLKAENAKLCETIERLEAENRRLTNEYAMAHAVVEGRKEESLLDAYKRFCDDYIAAKRSCREALAELAEAKDHAAALVVELGKVNGEANLLRAQVQQSQARSRVERARDRGGR